MDRLSCLIVVFAAAFAAVHLVPIWLGKSFPPFPIITTGSVVDLLTPLVMVLLYWLLFQGGRAWGWSQPTGWQDIAFLALAVIWVQGHSIHLPANAISLTLKGAGIGGDTQTVTALYDEHLGHYLWHFGMVGLSALIVQRRWRQPLAHSRPLPVMETAAGCLYGVIFFGSVIEGGTWPLGLPFAALAALLGVSRGWKHFRQQPVMTFFFTGYLVATALFIGWALYWGGLPQFTDIGFID